MTNRFLISVAAAALIAGTGFANAQGMSREGGGAAGGAATHQSAPSSERGAAPSTMNRDSGGAAKGAESGMKGSDSGMKAESSDKMPSSKSAQDTKMDAKGERSKSMSSENDAAKGGKDMKAEGRDSKSGMSAEGRDSKSGNMNAQTKGATDTKSQTTTGNAATSATAAPPAEKRTQIVSAIKSEKIQETTNVNFNISVGAMVPGTVRFHPLPARIVEIYPEWRGYDVIFVHGQYIIVRPQTHEIVYIIEG
ncbi:MAG: DUF1236 domain-containing protein [Bradyrhizobium sp.]